MNVLDRREGWTCLFAFLHSFGLLLLFSCSHFYDLKWSATPPNTFNQCDLLGDLFSAIDLKVVKFIC